MFSQANTPLILFYFSRRGVWSLSCYFKLPKSLIINKDQSRNIIWIHSFHDPGKPNIVLISKRFFDAFLKYPKLVNYKNIHHKMNRNFSIFCGIYQSLISSRPINGLSNLQANQRLRVFLLDALLTREKKTAGKNCLKTELY